MVLTSGGQRSDSDEWKGAQQQDCQRSFKHHLASHTHTTRADCYHIYTSQVPLNPVTLHCKDKWSKHRFCVMQYA